MTAEPEPGGLQATFEQELEEPQATAKPKRGELKASRVGPDPGRGVIRDLLVDGSQVHGSRVRGIRDFLEDGSWEHGSRVWGSRKWSRDRNHGG